MLLKFVNKKLLNKSFLSSELKKIVINECNIENCNFWEAKLSNSKFLSSKINKSIFTDANLNNADFSKSEIKNTNLSHANLRANFKTSKLIKVNLRDAVFDEKQIGLKILIQKNMEQLNIKILIHLVIRESYLTTQLNHLV